ncbi:MAG: hypothetical protein JRJ29_21420 [Deltaproteobacteria bacterium]|nr:hypothetical protein [Deltaproteobacteria bacterium]
MGYDVVVYPGSTLYAAAWAIKGVMEELVTTGTTRGYMDRMYNFSSFNKLMGLERFLEKERSYLEDRLE